MSDSNVPAATARTPVLLALDQGWSMRAAPLHCDVESAAVVLAEPDGWLPAALPCDVHQPLLAAGMIAEPLIGLNSFDSEWIEDRSWWFKKEFAADAALRAHTSVELTCTSLDAEADVFLNGVHLGHHRSAFYPFVCEVARCLREHNVLLIRVTSGLERYSAADIAGFCEQSTLTALKLPPRGDPRRIMVRKPQYVYGWDWGPRVATSGIVGSVFLAVHDRIAVRAVHVWTKQLAPAAELAFEVEVENLHNFATEDAIVEIDLCWEQTLVARVRQELGLRSGLNYISFSTTVTTPRLWWPNGLGGQPLYTVRTRVLYAGGSAVTDDLRVGIRTIKLRQGPLGNGDREFAFEVNGLPVFCKGANWVPVDSIYARIEDERYDLLLREARTAGFNMLRVWGGGLYEREAFYRKCDEYGILIWHDFMFACALYPDRLPWFRQEVEREIEYQTRRLRNHPSLALWCGNNEDHWGMDEWWTGAPHEKSLPPYFGGGISANEIAPRLVHRNSPEIPYWNSSPYGGKRPNEPRIGDFHHWYGGFMHPELEKRVTPQEYDRLAARFVSEYGYIGAPAKSSVLRYLGTDAIDRDGASWKHHTNAFENNTVAAGIRRHYADPEKLDDVQYLFYSGLCQALMYGYSLETFRSQPHCHGALFWMFSDCWGELGWTVIDYYGVRKAAYYAVRRAFTPVKLILRESGGIVRVTGINETTAVIDLPLRCGYVSFDGLEQSAQPTQIRLAARSRGIVHEFALPPNDRCRGVVFAAPTDGTAAVDPALLLGPPFRQWQRPAAAIVLEDARWEEGRLHFVVSSRVYAHAVHFNLPDQARCSDNYFDLLPEERRAITVENIPTDFPPAELRPGAL